MATVEVTKHLWDLLPALRGRTLTVEAATVAEVVQQVERMAPGFAFHVCDERGLGTRLLSARVASERARAAAMPPAG